MDNPVKLVIGVSLAALIITLVLQNTEPVPTHILFWSPQLPGAVLGLTMLLGGFILGLLSSRARRRRKSKGSTSKEEEH